jgi:CDP-6-deoxy-D-xylo-4-hexulose-3-dehydrase
MGEGGAVITNDTTLKRLVESFRDWGRDCWCPSGQDNTCGNRFGRQFGELPKGYDHKYMYSHFGYNLKVTDMQAAIGCAQLEKLPDFIDARKRKWQALHDGLAHMDERFILPEATPHSDPSWFGFLLTVREGAGFTRDDLVAQLESSGIQTRMLFAGNLIKHPCFDEMRNNNTGYRAIGGLANTDRIMRDTFWVGVYPGMSGEMLAYMVQTISEFLG